MKKIRPSFPRKLWIFGLPLVLLPFSVRAGEVRSFFRSAAVFTRGDKSGSSAQALQGSYATTIGSQYASNLVLLNSDKVLLALPAGSEKADTLMVAGGPECLEEASPRVVPEANLQTQVALRHSADKQPIPHPGSIVDSRSTSIPFQLTDSLIYMQASLNGSQPLWMMLDTGSSVTVFDESVSKTLGLRFLGEGSAYGPGQGSPQSWHSPTTPSSNLRGRSSTIKLWRRCLWNGSRTNLGGLPMGSSVPIYSATMSLKSTTQTRCSVS